jgi:hypothetical protein
VDLWDLTKLLFRRWYVFLPMLVASTAVVFFVSQETKPDYSATGHLQLIPPTVAATPNTSTVRKSTNPWTDLGFLALGNAVVLKVQDKKVLDSLVAQGYTDNFTVSVTYNTTYFSIEAVGRTPQQATATVQQLMKLLDAEVVAQQQQFGATRQDSISTLVLDSGDKVTVVTSKKKRVLIVSGGLAVLLSAGATIALDAVLRRRTRRRAEPDGNTELLMTATPATVPPTARRGTNGSRELEPAGANEQPSALAVSIPAGSSSARTEAVRMDLRTSDVVADRLSWSERAMETQPDADATVILPLPLLRSPSREDKSKGR